MTNSTMCGISELEDRDMKIFAQFYEQTITTDELRYIEEVPLPDAPPAQYDSCYYEIGE